MRKISYQIIEKIVLLFSLIVISIYISLALGIILSLLAYQLGLHKLERY